MRSRPSEMLRVMNSADQEVAHAVERDSAYIAPRWTGWRGVSKPVGGSLYLGAGLPAGWAFLTRPMSADFNTPAELVQGIIAGGDRALLHSIEKAEDDPEQGRRDLTDAIWTPPTLWSESQPAAARHMF